MRKRNTFLLHLCEWLHNIHIITHILFIYFDFFCSLVLRFFRVNYFWVSVATFPSGKEQKNNNIQNSCVLFIIILLCTASTLYPFRIGRLVALAWSVWGSVLLLLLQPPRKAKQQKPQKYSENIIIISVITESNCTEKAFFHLFVCFGWLGMKEKNNFETFWNAKQHIAAINQHPFARRGSYKEFNLRSSLFFAFVIIAVCTHDEQRFFALKVCKV